MGKYWSNTYPLSWLPPTVTQHSLWRIFCLTLCVCSHIWTHAKLDWYHRSVKAMTYLTLAWTRLLLSPPRPPVDKMLLSWYQCVPNLIPDDVDLVLHLGNPLTHNGKQLWYGGARIYEDLQTGRVIGVKEGEGWRQRNKCGIRRWTWKLKGYTQPELMRKEEKTNKQQDLWCWCHHIEYFIFDTLF